MTRRAAARLDKETATLHYIDLTGEGEVLAQFPLDRTVMPFVDYQVMVRDKMFRVASISYDLDRNAIYAHVIPHKPELWYCAGKGRWEIE